jgi:hypothetical protein
MRWQKKDKPKKPILGIKAPEPGDTREFIKFALFPKKIGDKGYVWLERYIEVEVWRKGQSAGPFEEALGSQWAKHESGYNPSPRYSWTFKHRKYIS